ncbi:hypothetical protein HPB49_009303 [Dermacentor silvarum]|uniref:Uncharacterized protein n=1 Tax=Dermacentor silvarum TaxID=543639 RepID=A0ACB8CQW2_DERSI|nr:hypothetical protein HPB49_009303 [Dermacentor silvarum]
MAPRGPSREQPYTFEFRAPPPKLCLVGFDSPHPVDTLQDQLHEAATLVYLLLTKHNCVTTLNLGSFCLNEYEAVLWRSLENNTSIRNLKLRLSRLQATTPLWREVVQALSRNVTITEVRLRAVCMNTEDVELLAAVVASSKRIHTFHFVPQRTSSAFIFLQALSGGVAENITLLNFTLHWGVNSEMVKTWFAVSDATRRNSGLVARAAQFVGGARNDRQNWHRAIRNIEPNSWIPIPGQGVHEVEADVSLHEAFTETGYGTAISAYLWPEWARATSVLPSRDQSIIIAHTPDIEAADRLIGDFAVNTEKGSVPFHGYLRQDGENTCHGVIVVRNTDTTETLQH